MRLFLPRTNSIGSEADFGDASVGGADARDDELVSISDLHRYEEVQEEEDEPSSELDAYAGHRAVAVAAAEARASPAPPGSASPSSASGARSDAASEYTTTDASLEQLVAMHKQSRPGLAGSSVAASVSSTASLRATERQLKVAEKAFLSAQQVRGGATLEAIQERFKLTEMPDNPLARGEEHVDRYMDDLVNNAVKDAVNTASPSMIGHMTSSLPYFMRPLSRLVTTMNQNTVKTETANTITFLEREAMAQLHRQIYARGEDFYAKYAQNPALVLGVFASGGTLANVSALWVARNLALGPRDGFDGVEQEGLAAALQHYGYRGAVIVGSELLHYSMAKAADVLGLGVRALSSVPFDGDFRVRVDLMEQRLEQCARERLLVVAVLGVAGATETGSIDDLEAIAALSRRHGAHFHVDAAWGGPCIFSRRHRALLRGIEQAHSVTLDGHKQLYMPMGCGLCFFREPEMSLAVRKTAKYIIRKDSHDLGKFTLEGSRPANAVFLHSNLTIFGVRGYEILVDRSIRMVAYMARRVDESQGVFQLVVRPMTNILLYRCIPLWLRDKARDRSAELLPEENRAIDALNVELQTRQTLQGKTFVSRTTVRSPVYDLPIVALRVVIANPLTFEKDIDRVLENQLEILDEIPVGYKQPAGSGPLSVAGAATAAATTTATAAATATATATADAEAAATAQGIEPSTRVATPPPPPDAKTTRYWTEYWTTMPREMRQLFKDNKELFLSSLVAPDLKLDDGLFTAERVRSASTLIRRATEERAPKVD
jgi:glutamate decarboxylase